MNTNYTFLGISKGVSKYFPALLGKTACLEDRPMRAGVARASSSGPHSMHYCRRPEVLYLEY